jgi:sulfatase maturation enzyme AslB (radical SAM superfamily)
MTSLYGFQEGLPEAYPSQIIVDITEVCNLKCIHCPHPTFKKSEYYDGRMLSAELNRKLVDDVRNDANGNCQYIRYTSNGEPLSHPLAHEMIQYAVEHSNTFVTLTTNGTILNKRKMNALLDSGLHMIDISIDANTEMSYKKIRGGDFNKVVKNVCDLLDEIKRRRSKTSVVLSFIKQPDNINEAKDFESFWLNKGVNEVVIRNLHTAAGSLSHSQSPMAGRRPCLYPWERLTLDSKGHLAYCPTDWKYGSTFVDFRNSTISQAWKSSFMQEIREMHLKNAFKNDSFCKNCPDWRLTNWPKQGRRYANLIEDLKVVEA